MLSSMRRAKSSWIVLLLLGLIMVAFVITGFGTGGGGLGDLGGAPDRIVKVGSETITEQDANRRLNQELKAAQQRHAELDMAQFVKMGALNDVMEQLIVERAQIAFAAKHGIVVSKRMVDGEIAGEPAFHNTAGVFDENAFRAALSRVGITETELRESIRLNALRRQLLMPLSVGGRMPTRILDFYVNLLLETRTGSIGAIPINMVGPGPAPTEAEIAARFKEQPRRYTIPERRAIRYATFGWADVVNNVQATDAEIEAAYKQGSATYGPKESRTIVQLTLPDQAAANAFAARVKGGATFAAAAAAAGFGPGDIAQAQGTSADVGRVLTPEMTKASFAAAQGATIGPIRSALGWQVAKVETITRSGGQTLASVRDELARTIQQRKGAEALAALVGRIDDAITSDATFDEVVKANKLQIVETPPVTASGAAFGSPYRIPVEIQPALKTAFGLDPEDDPMVETLTQGQRYAVVAVKQVIDPTLPPLAQVHDRVKADIINQRAAERTKKIADDIVAKINAGMPIQQAFAGAGVALPPVQTETMRRAEATEAGDKLPAHVAAIFALAKGKAKAVPAPDRSGWFVATVNDIRPSDGKDAPRLAQTLKQPFDNSQNDEIVGQTLRAMEREMGIDRNDGAIQRLRRKLEGAGVQ